MFSFPKNVAIIVLYTLSNSFENILFCTFILSGHMKCKYGFQFSFSLKNKRVELTRNSPCLFLLFPIQQNSLILLH